MLKPLLNESLKKWKISLLIPKIAFQKKEDFNYTSSNYSTQERCKQELSQLTYDDYNLQESMF